MGGKGRYDNESSLRGQTSTQIGFFTRKIGLEKHPADRLF